MAAKKRTKKQLAEFKRRSEASKRGWVTRRKKIVKTEKRKIEVIQAHIKKKKVEKKVVKKKRKKGGIEKELSDAKREIEELRKEQEKLKQIMIKEREEELQRIEKELKKKFDEEFEYKLELLRVEEMEKGIDWIDLLPDEWLRVDKSIAVQYSSLRANADKAGVFNFLWEENAKGNLDNACMVMAVKFQIPLREVYTFWFSP